MSWFFDFGYLILTAVILIGGFLWAGYKTKNLGVIIFGYTFAVIMGVVFAGEGLSFWLTPDHISMSNSFGKFYYDYPLYAWFLLTAWIAFAWALAVHLASRKKK